MDEPEVDKLFRDLEAAYAKERLHERMYATLIHFAKIIEKYIPNHLDTYASFIGQITRNLEHAVDFEDAFSVNPPHLMAKVIYGNGRKTDVFQIGSPE